MGFQNWLADGLKNNKFGETPEADFARDAINDKSFRDFKTWDQLETYIIFRGACREAIKAAKKCFRRGELERGEK